MTRRLRPCLSARPLKGGVALVASVGVIGVLAAAPASAVVSFALTGTSIAIYSDGTGDSIQVTCVSGTARVNGDDSTIACSALTGLTVDAGAGSDTVNLNAVTAAGYPALKRTRVVVGSVDTYDSDVVIGSALADRVLGDSGDTVTLGAGDDYVERAASASGGSGDDVLVGVTGSVDGGEGDDLILNPGSGPFAGGSGTDTMRLDYDKEDLLGAAPITEITFGFTNTAISVTAPGLPSQVLPMSGMEVIDLRQPAGVAREGFVSTAFAGRVLVDGLDGIDTIRTGPGDDVLDGGTGADVLEPGAGRDFVQGGSGNDTVRVRDGQVDIVDCGLGADTVVADVVDQVRGCEVVQLPAPTTGAIAGPKKVVKGKAGAFTFTGTGTSFQCRVDAKAWTACRSPYAVPTKKLAQGKHKLSVRAVLAGGNVDATPSVRTFRVV